MERTNNFWTVFPEKDSCQKFRFIISYRASIIALSEQCRFLLCCMPHCREPSQINKHLDEKLAYTCTSKKNFISQ